MSEETVRLIRKKKRLYKKAKPSDTQGDLLRYKRVSNMVRRLTRRDHQDHLEDISCQLVENQQIFWRWLKNVRGQSAGIANLKYMGNILTAAVDKAKVFNHYFRSVFAKENISNLPRLRSLLWATWSTPSIADIEFDVDEVHKVLCRIDPSKACGPDEILGRLLREGAPWLAEPITKLFSMSLQSGSLPRDWRRANVAPVFKRDNKHSSSNYRPVGELP